MKKSYATILAILFSAFFVFAAPALAANAPKQPAGNVKSLKASTGNPEATYYKMQTQIATVCSTPPLEIMESDGTPTNITRLQNNKVNIIWAQEDNLYAAVFEGDTEIHKLKVFKTMYNEEVHFLARRNDQFINAFSDMGNKRIAIWGGAIKTAPVLTSKTGVRPIGVKVAKDNKDAMQMLDNNVVDMVIAVGGQPVDWISSLDSRKYKIVPFDKKNDGVASVYSDAMLRYPNLSATPVPSIATRTLMVTRDYESPDMVTSLWSLRKCIDNNLVTLSETTDFHPKWDVVKRNKSKSKWPAYSFGGRDSSAPAKSKNVKKKVVKKEAAEE